ncbi:MAG: flavin reductase family protein [Erythrobacter sp.]
MPSDPTSENGAIEAASDPRAFRAALGSFATGVTIATTMDEDGEPIGVTASSFNSVSLDPPLVLWSLSKASLSRPAFIQSGHFAIHVLASDQSALSDRFARSQSNKWDGLAWHKGTLGSPLLDEHAAVFECKTRHEYDGGDHIILVGEVVEFEVHSKAPLLFHAGQYAQVSPLPKTK